MEVKRILSVREIEAIRDRLYEGGEELTLPEIYRMILSLTSTAYFYARIEESKDGRGISKNVST